MATLNNLTQGNVAEVEKLVESMKATNKNLTCEIHEQEDMDLASKLNEVVCLLKILDRRIKHIFGDAVLINGQFVDIKPREKI